MIELYKDIEYSVVRSRRKTSSILIERDGNILLRIPEEYKQTEVDELIEKKRFWIYKQLAEWRDLNATRVIREYKNGEGFLYLGRSYRLKFVEGQTQRLVLKGGYFCLESSLSEDADKCTQTFVDFYKEKGLHRIPERVAYFAPKLGLDPNQIRIMELKYRWASCTDGGNLNFHWKCMMAPPTVLDYVVVHELCHLKFKKHTEAFWNEVDKVIPDYRNKVKWLRTNGAGMDL